MTKRVVVIETTGPATHKTVRKRDEDDTIRTTIQETASQASIDVALATDALMEAAKESKDAARSLLFESRRTRMASRPGMKRPPLK